MRENFRKFRPGDILPAEWPNAVGRVLNRMTHSAPVFNHQGMVTSTAAASAYNHSHNDFRQVVIDEVEDENYGRYTATYRIYSHEDSEWQNTDDDEEDTLIVDAFAYGNGLILVPGDVMTCHWHAQAGVLVPINPPLERLCKADGTVQINNQGTFSIWKWNGSAMVDTEFDLQARLQWMHGNDSSNLISLGKQAIARYFVESGIYFIVEAECET